MPYRRSVSLVTFILAIMAMIIIHELGHLAAAKWLGMHAPTFSLFFGRPILKKHWRGTDYQMGWLPLGGFVKISGMSREEELPDGVTGTRYCDAPIWKRIIVILAGPVANLVLAFLLLFIFYATSVPEYRVDPVVATSEQTAKAIGLRPGDRVVQVGDVRSNDAETLITAIRSRDGAALPVVIRRGDTERTVTIPAGSTGPIGIMFQQERTGSRSLGVIGAARASADELWWQTTVTTTALAQIATDEKMRGELSTIVGIGAMSDEASDAGMMLRFLAAISFMLFFFNLLPILPLDGGHILFALIEGVRRKPISTRTYNMAAVAGIAILLLGFVVGIQNDIGRLSG